MLRSKSLVVGSTGLVGKSLVSQLIEADQPVRALVRNDQENTNPLLEYLKIDFDNLQLSYEALSDVKDLFICLGTTIKKAGSKEAFQKVDINYCFEIAREAQTQGVRNISIITSVGSDSSASNFYIKTKGVIEEKIAAMDFDSIAIHRPGLLIGPRDELRTAELIGQKIYPLLLNPLLMGSLRRYRCINGGSLARAMINLSGSKEGVNFYYYDDFKENQ